MSVKVTSALQGAEQLARALKLAVPATKARVVAAIQKNTKVIAAEARARAPKVTGELVSTIRDEYSVDGLIGYVKVGRGKLPRRSKVAKGTPRAKTRKRSTGLGAYAPVIEHGDPRRGRKAEPFLIPGFVAQKPTAIKDIDQALNASMNEVKT